MDEKSIREVLRDVLGPGVKMKNINGWVSLSCPLAPWKHDKAIDTRASAGVHITEQGDTSVFNCYACKTKVPFHALIRMYGEFTGDDFDDIVEAVRQEDWLGPRDIPTWDETKQADEDEILVPLKKEIYLDLYESAAGHPYLRERGISDATARKLQLMYDPEDPADGYPRILFPVFGPDGELYGLSGRDVTGEAPLKVRDYQGFKKRLCLLGSHLIVAEKSKRVLVVEGLFDYANAWECGQPAVAAMHSSLTKQQVAILHDLGRPVYLFFDNPKIDKAGAAGVIAAGDALGTEVPVLEVRYPDVYIEKPDGSEALIGDPGELNAEEFEEMIQDARLYVSEEAPYNGRTAGPKRRMVSASSAKTPQRGPRRDSFT